MVRPMGENQYFNAQDAQRAALKESAQGWYLNNFPELVDPRKRPPEPPQRPPQDIDAYLNNLFKELGDLYRQQFNRAPPPGLFEKLEGD